MATKRFGYLDDLSLKNQKVGIGTSTANEKLEVLGGTKGGDVVVAGIATLTTYSGFDNKKTSYVENISIDSGESGTLSGEVVIGAGLTMSVGTGATTGQGSIKSLKVSNTFNPPIGGTNDRPSAPKLGSFYYNKDFRTIEYWDGNFWRQVDNVAGRGRAVFGGGYSPAQPTYVSSMDYVEIASRGNAQGFGTLVTTSYSQAGSASEVRGIISGQAGYGDAIEYISIASKSNGVDFGNLSVARSSHSTAWNSSTRSVFAGGYASPGASSNVIDYVEINTLGNAIDFGDLDEPRYGCSSMSSPVRGVCGGGRNHPGGESPIGTKMIDYTTIASKGNAVRFGDLYAKHSYMVATGNSVRGIFAAGTNPNNPSMSYITIASEGNSQYFGELDDGNPSGKAMGNSSNSTIGLFAGGGPSSGSDVIESVQLSTASNGLDFGDLTITRGYPFGLSNSNGGLGGY